MVMIGSTDMLARRTMLDASSSANIASHSDFGRRFGAAAK